MLGEPRLLIPAGLLLLSACSFASPAYHIQPRQVEVAACSSGILTGNINTAMAYYAVSPEDLRDTVPWTPELGLPPLSPADAVKIARQAASATSQPEELSISSIELKPTCATQKDRWYYVISFDVASDRDATVRIVVLLNGAVVVPTPLPTQK